MRSEVSVPRLVETPLCRRSLRDLFVITRPKNKVLFYLLRISSVRRCIRSDAGKQEKWTRPISIKFLAGTEDSDNIGCIVMNCNPFTKGHLALITYAARACDLLHIFVVEETAPSSCLRTACALSAKGTDHLANVIVHPSGPYMISNATFLTLFLKEGEDAAKIQRELDITPVRLPGSHRFFILKALRGKNRSIR